MIPTYGPSMDTLSLVGFLLRHHPEMSVIVIDDCTPKDHPGNLVMESISRLADKFDQLTTLRTEKNSLKAGALNHGLNYVLNQPAKPEIIFTFDDDVEILPDTLPNMIRQLDGNPRLGAVCTQALVKNKNANLITRLQSLEYHNFNVTKLADNNFIMGPLVMQGMLTAFRLDAIEDVDGFATNHLIEDYDITVRIKQQGWQVGLAKDAYALTVVPETFEQLWRQRARWSYGGLKVTQDFWKKPLIIFQDILGHLMFLGLAALVGLSYSLNYSGGADQRLVMILLVIAVTNFAIQTAFNIATLATYKSRDKTDVLLKVLILPEFIYSNILALILIGSYVFYLYNAIFQSIAAMIQSALWLLKRIHFIGLLGFQRIGFTSTWGTK